MFKQHHSFQTGTSWKADSAYSANLQFPFSQPTSLALCIISRSDNLHQEINESLVVMTAKFQWHFLEPRYEIETKTVPLNTHTNKRKKRSYLTPAKMRATSTLWNFEMWKFDFTPTNVMRKVRRTFPAVNDLSDRFGRCKRDNCVGEARRNKRRENEKKNRKRKN